MRKHVLFLSLCLALGAQAVNQAYYSSLNGKSDETLREALTQLLYTHHTTFVSYNWSFPYDYDSEGNMLDIYSDCGFKSYETYPSNYKCCCDAINREHVVCQSNFGGSDSNGKIPQYSDRHHLYPVDGRANGHRSDLPFGECSNGQHGTCSNASTVYPEEGNQTCANHEYGRSGTSTFSVPLPSGGGKVYEVGDAYKGDIARAILYMVVRYATEEYCRLPNGARNATTNLLTPNQYPVTAWANTTQDKVGQMFSNSLSINHGLSPYGLAILIKWHRQDPVSQKEIDRNDGVETAQGNRNPFVDYPYLVEYLWGTKTGNAFNTSNVVGSFEDDFIVDVSDGSKADAPTITVSSTAVTMDQVMPDGTTTKTITIAGTNLTGPVSIAKSGSSFITLSASSVSVAEAQNGKTITITYHPSSSGDHSATLTLSSPNAENKSVTVSGSCCTPYIVTLYRNGLPDQYNCCGAFTLPVPATEDDACDGWTFRGWGTDETVNTTTQPDFTTTLNAAATLYAVYGNSGNPVTYKTMPCIAYTVATEDEDGITEGGQYFVSVNSAIAGAVISLEAETNDGYTFTGWRVTKTDDPNTLVDVISNQFTLPEYSVTVKALFTAIPTYTATWMANGNQHALQTGLHDNETPQMPDDPADYSESRVFIGWTSQAGYAHASIAPNDLFSTTAPSVTGNVTFYAVYADRETSGGESTDTTIIMASYAAISGTFGSYTFTAVKNNGSTQPTYNDNGKDARLYAKGSLTISSNKTLKEIVFNLSPQGEARLAPIMPSVGTIATQNAGDNTVTWTGAATSVEFTVGEKADYGSEGSSKAGQLCFLSVDISGNTPVIATYSNYSLNRSDNPTDMENLDGGTYPVAQKILYQGQMVIRRGNAVYTLFGQQIR